MHNHSFYRDPIRLPHRIFIQRGKRTVSQLQIYAVLSELRQLGFTIHNGL